MSGEFKVAQENLIREWNTLVDTLEEVLGIKVIGVGDTETSHILWTAFCRDQPLGKYQSITDAYKVALQEVAERIK